MSELMSQMSAALRSRHYSRRTEQAYCLWVRRSSASTASVIQPTWPSPRSTHSSLTWPSMNR